jgi:hypothetical protein
MWKHLDTFRKDFPFPITSFFSFLLLLLLVLSLRGFVFSASAAVFHRCYLPSL